MVVFVVLVFAVAVFVIIVFLLVVFVMVVFVVVGGCSQMMSCAEGGGWGLAKK